MFDSDPNGEWNIFPDPTTGDVGVYHKGNYLGSVDGNESEDPPRRIRARTIRPTTTARPERLST